MPPKNGTKKKKPKTPAEKEYTLLTFEEMKVKEQKYNNRLMELRKCLSFIDGKSNKKFSNKNHN